jgi:hypothetical protein
MKCWNENKEFSNTVIQSPKHCVLVWLSLTEIMLLTIVVIVSLNDFATLFKLPFLFKNSRDDRFTYNTKLEEKNRGAASIGFFT